METDDFGEQLKREWHAGRAGQIYDELHELFRDLGRRRNKRRIFREIGRRLDEIDETAA